MVAISCVPVPIKFSSVEISIFAPPDVADTVNALALVNVLAKYIVPATNGPTLAENTIGAPDTRLEQFPALVLIKSPVAFTLAVVTVTYPPVLLVNPIVVALVEPFTFAVNT